MSIDFIGSYWLINDVLALVDRAFLDFIGFLKMGKWLLGRDS